jgi:hypothetical protein
MSTLLAGGYSLSESQWQILTKVLYDDTTGDITTEGALTVGTFVQLKDYGASSPSPSTGGALWVESPGGLNDEAWFYDGTGAANTRLLDPNYSFAGDVTGTSGALSVDKIQGYAVQDHAPTDGEALLWVAANSRYEPGTPSGPTVSHVRAYNNSSQSISTGVLTTVQLSSESFDDQGDFNTGTYRFIAPSTGYYSVQVEILVPATATNWFAYINNNGTGVVEVSHHGTGSGSSTLHIHDLVSMTSGNYLEVQVFQFSGGSLFLGSGSNHTFMTVIGPL